MKSSRRKRKSRGKAFQVEMEEFKNDDVGVEEDEFGEEGAEEEEEEERKENKEEEEEEEAWLEGKEATKDADDEEETIEMSNR